MEKNMKLLIKNLKTEITIAEKELTSAIADLGLSRKHFEEGEMGQYSYAHFCEGYLNGIKVALNSTKNYK